MLLKSTTLVILLLGFAGVAFSAVAVGPPSTHPDHPGKCWDEETNKAYEPNTVFTLPNQCTRVRCLSDFSFDYATCGVLVAEPPCYVTDGDLSLEYPLCCPGVKCPKPEA